MWWAQLARRVHHEKENLTTKGKSSATQSVCGVSYSSAARHAVCAGRWEQLELWRHGERNEEVGVFGSECFSNQTGGCGQVCALLPATAAVVDQIAGATSMVRQLWLCRCVLVSSRIACAVLVRCLARSNFQ